jgi:hypothetical protein
MQKLKAINNLLQAETHHIIARIFHNLPDNIQKHLAAKLSKENVYCNKKDITTIQSLASFSDILDFENEKILNNYFNNL